MAQASEVVVGLFHSLANLRQQKTNSLVSIDVKYDAFRQILDPNSFEVVETFFAFATKLLIASKMLMKHA